MKIFKKQIAMAGTVSLELPQNAKIIRVAWQPGSGPCIWFMFDSDVTHRRGITTVMTGESFDDLGEYVGSFQTDDGSFVGHVFEYTED